MFRKRWWMLLIALAAVSALPTMASAGDGTLHFGPFPGISPDSGTCGNNWANDTVERFFTISPDNPNIVIEEFKNGTFVTVAGASPGACQSGTYNGNAVGAGVTGKFHGSFDIAVTGGTFNPNATCTGTACNTTAGFIATFYGPGATYVSGATYFIFHYSTGHNGEWKNASANRGGNHGDITGAP